MRAYVFTDKALGRYAGRFVWLSIDTENSTNSRFLQKFPINVWPTLMVIDPQRESVVMRYSGGATVPQLEKLLDESSASFRAKHASPADTLLASADRFVSEEKNEEAAKAYESAISRAPKNWPSLGRAAESLTLALLLLHDNDRCATVSRELYPRLQGTASGAIVATNGISCALELPGDRPGRKELVDYFENATRAALHDGKLAISADDRSSLYDALVSARRDAKDDAGAERLLAEWAAFLEEQAAKGKTAEQRAVYDSHRLGVYLDQKKPEKAIPMLEQSQKDFPQDYNPPARLAVAYKAMGRFDDALAASSIALSKAYGPRKIGIYRTRADIFAAKGDNKAARATVEEAIRYAKSLPAGQRSEPAIASLEKKLTTIPQ